MKKNPRLGEGADKLQTNNSVNSEQELTDVLEVLPEVSKLKKEVFAPIVNAWKESNDGVNENEVLDGILDELGLEKNKETRYIAYQRLYTLKSDKLENYLKHNSFDDGEVKKITELSYKYTSRLYSDYNRKFLVELKKLNILPSFYIDLLEGFLGLSDSFNNFFLNWNKHILEQNKELAEEYGDKESVLEHLKKSDLLEKDDNGEILPFSHSVLIDGKMVSYAEAFENDIKQILSKLDKLIQNLSKYDNEEAKNYVVYLQTLKEALAEKDIKKLSSKWKKVDETWMNVKSPFQIVHMMEYYEDIYRKSVTPTIDIRISNPGIFKSQASKNIEKVFEKFYAKMCPNDKYPEVYQLSKKGYKSVQIYIGEPLMGGGDFYEGYPSAQVIPNDDEISKKYGKKVFSFSEDILEWRRNQPRMKLDYLVYDEDFLSDWYNLFYNEDIYYATEDILTIGHEFGHTLWLAEGTESAINGKTGNFKNIEEWKATTGGLMILFNGEYSEEIKKYTILNHIRRTLSWLRYKEYVPMRPYYNEALIDLELLYKSGVLKINNGKVIFDYTEENYEKLKEIYTREYEELIKLYLERKDAGEFLYKFVEVQNDGTTLPKDKKLKEFTIYYHNLADKLGAETININSTKEKVLAELDNPNFPNLKFLFSDEVLDIAEELLLELLEKDKQRFEDVLKLKNEDITFDIFVERSDLYTFWHYLSHLSGVNDSDKIRKIKDAVLPKLVEFGNEISYSKRYFEMLKYCLSNCNLDEEQKKIIEDEIRDFEIKGIGLEKDKQEQLKKINKELSELSKNFSKNVLDSEKEFEFFLETDEYLKEFPESDLENAKVLAEKKGKKGYAFDSSYGSYFAIMKYCSNSDVRKHFYIEGIKTASSGKFDNREIVLKIINLKDQKAKLLGYKNFAELSLEDKMADSPEEVMDLLESISKKAKNKAQKEIEELKEYFDLEEINPWDIYYYLRRIKQEKYNLDERKMKEYFEFEETKKALFDTVKKLYNVEMKPLKTNGEYDENVEIYEVYKDGKLISYFVGDYFYNENKRSGAWANAIRSKSEDRIPVVVNVLGIVKSKNSETLMTLGEVETMFHEFGHALHVMLSKSKYPELSGFGVEWDFVELPSQLMEKWVSDESTIKNITKHYKTGEVLDDDLFEAYRRLEHFGTGNYILGQSIYAITDMMFYSGTKFESVEDLDKKYLDKVNELSLFKQSKENKRYASFSHIFAGGYSAGYYSYMWADIIVEDIWEEFKKNGVFDIETAKRYEEKILSAGSIKPAKGMFKDFMGRDIKPEAFMKKNGFI